MLVDTIKSRREFSRVFHEGTRVNHPLVRATVLPVSEGAPSRVAFVAAKRLGNAVYRNRCKRVMREAARIADMSSSAADVIFFATPATHDAHPDEVARAIGRLRRRASF